MTINDNQSVKGIKDIKDIKDLQAILSQPIGDQKLTVKVETEEGIELLRMTVHADVLARLMSNLGKVMETTAPIIQVITSKREEPTL